MRRTISDETWSQIKVAHAAGIGLRESARNLGVAASTVLSRAQREGLTQQIATAKLISLPKPAANPMRSNAITPLESTAITMQQRGAKHVEKMSGISERVVDHVGSMQPAEVLGSIHEVEKFDRMARRTYGLSDGTAPVSAFSLNILAGNAAIQIVQPGE